MSIKITENHRVSLRDVAATRIWDKTIYTTEALSTVSVAAEVLSIKAVLSNNNQWLIVYIYNSYLILDIVVPKANEFVVSKSQIIAKLRHDWQNITVTCDDPISISGVPPNKQRFVFDGDKFVLAVDDAAVKEVPK